MKKIISLIFLMVGFTVFSQNTGKITDQNNNPLPGASIVIKDTTQGTTEVQQQGQLGRNFTLGLTYKF